MERSEILRAEVWQGINQKTGHDDARLVTRPGVQFPTGGRALGPNQTCASVRPHDGGVSRTMFSAELRNQERNARSAEMLSKERLQVCDESLTIWFREKCMLKSGAIDGKEVVEGEAHFEGGGVFVEEGGAEHGRIVS